MGSRAEPTGGRAPRICIVQPRLGVLTETFIEAHRRHLPGVVMRLDCDPFPIATEDGEPLLSLLHPRVHRALGRLFGLSRERADGALARRVPAHIREGVLLRRLRKERLDVVLAEYGPTGVAVQRVCAKAGLPLVVLFHGYDASHRPTLDRYLPDYRRLFIHASAIVAVSRQMRSQLIDLGAAPEKVAFNPYGIDVEAFSSGHPEDAPPTLLAVGRFVDKKAPDLTIAAFAKIADRLPKARLEMIGDGPLEASCRQRARELGVAEGVLFRGPLPHTEVARAMHRARCLVQHSVTPDSGDMEGTPLAILEAMASGLPVIATRHGGILDVVGDGETGLLVDERDVDGMAKAMARLTENPETAARMGEAGRRFVLDHHTMERRIENLASILEAAVSPRTPA
jgi:glycosyltransferase involved in cell wall biosynthesis